ncbi:MAG: metallophosphoesterase family protein [Pseudomonadota bacterium]
MRRLALAATCLVASLTTAQAEPFSFTALGDMPYGRPEVVFEPFKALIEEINQRNPDLVIHVGDTMGGTPCSDEALDQQLAFLNTFSAPTLYTPGDNEWTDCHRSSSGGFDPVDRLAYIRATYFADPATSLGQRQIPLEHQGTDGYPENARMTHKNVAFITAHVVGSNNNFEIRDMSAVEEFFARNKANIEWLEESFTASSAAEAIVVAVHADMFEFDFNEWKRERWLRHSGFGQFGDALRKQVRKFGKPVLLIFGDSHRHKVFRPFENTAPNVLAMEVFGYPSMDAVSVKVDTSLDQPFSFTPIVNPAL